jgi:uncharacterized protein YjbI with pentapeptide repeats
MKSDRLICQDELNETIIDLHVHQPILIRKHKQTAQYDIKYHVNKDEEVHFCHGNHKVAVSAQLFDKNGTELLSHVAIDGCQSINLNAGDYTLRVISTANQNIFVHNQKPKIDSLRNKNRQCTDANSDCVIVAIDAEGCEKCNFNNFFLAPDLDNPTKTIDFTNHNFKDTTWSNMALIQINFDGSDFSGGIFGDSCGPNSSECSSDTNGVFGAKNSFKSCNFSDIRFNAGAISGNFTDAKFTNANISNTFYFYYYDGITNSSRTQLPKLYKQRYGDDKEMGDLSQFGVNSNGENAVLDNIDFSTASIGDDFDNLTLFSMLSMKNVIFPKYMNLNGVALNDCDLSGTDFSQASLEMSEADFSNSILSNANLSGKDLVNANLSCTKLDYTDISGVNLNKINFGSNNSCTIYTKGLNISKSKKFTNDTLVKLQASGFDFSGANFSDYNFSDTDLTDFTCKSCNFTNSIFENVNFTNTDFTLAKMQKSTIKNSDISKLKLIDTSLEYANFDNITGFDSAQLRRTNLKYISFKNMDLSNMNFDYLELTNANLSKQNLSNASFVSSKLNNVDFSYSDLSNLDLSNLNLDNIKLHASNISKTDFTDSNLSNINFSKALNVKNTLFHNTKITDCDFSKLDLQGYDWKNNTLENDNFTNANLKNAHFYYMDLKSINFTGVDFSKHTFFVNSMHDVIFDNAILRNTNFSQVSDYKNISFKSATMSGANLSYRVMRGSDFSNAKLKNLNCKEADFSGSDFRGSSIANANFSSATEFNSANFDNLDFSNLSNLKYMKFSNISCVGTDFHGLNMSHTNLKNARCHSDGKGANFKDTTLEYTDLSDADMRYSDFNGVDFNNYTDLGGANMSHVDFRDSDLRHADLSRSTNFSYADFRYLDMHDITLDYRNLSHLKCYKTDFSDTNLGHSNMSHADCNYANFDNASLYKTDLSDSYVQYANFNNANFHYGEKSGMHCEHADINIHTKWTGGYKCDEHSYNLTAYLKDDGCVQKCNAGW